jgi:hypothetical protein
LAWRRGARLDGWTEHFNARRWWSAMADAAIDIAQIAHEPYPVGAVLPWDHVNVKVGRTFLEKEHGRSVVQLGVMADSAATGPTESAHV